MSNYFTTDTELTSIANAIRTKGETSASLTYPSGFVNAINAIETGITPTGIKYVYTDIDSDCAYNVSDYEKVSVDYGDIGDGKFRLWIETTEANTTFSFEVNTDNEVVCYCDWGDSTKETINSNGNSPATVPGVGYGTTFSHIFIDAGRYCITLSSDNNLIGGIKCQNNNYLKGVEIASYISSWVHSNYFSGCINLERITFPPSNIDTTTNIGQSICANCSSLKKVVFRSNASAIPSFYGCTSLTEITLPATVGTLSGSLFQNCSSLRKVNGFENLTITNLPQYMFAGCMSLLSIVLPSTIVDMGNQPFSNSALQTITFPAGVTTISRQACADCTYLKEVHILATTPPSVYTGYYDSFKNAHPNLVIYVPSEALSAYQAASGWSNYNIQAEPT